MNITKRNKEILKGCLNTFVHNELAGTALNNIVKPDKLASTLRDKANTLRPLMHFFVSVCLLEKYRQAIKPVLTRLSERYKLYTNKFAERLNCSAEEIAPFLYTVIDTMLSYMLFGQENFKAPQLDIVFVELKKLLKRQKA